MVTKLALIALPLSFVTACAPSKVLSNRSNLPEQWAGRLLWVTPNAHIYAAREESAGELDRLTARTRQEYAAKVGGPTPPPLIIVYDAGEVVPGGDFENLLHCAVRLAALRDMESPADSERLDAKVADTLAAMQMSAIALGTTIDVLAGMTSLECDASCLRSVCQAPEELAGKVDFAVILPSRTRLRQNAHRIVKDAQEQFQIGPVAQMLFEPVSAIVRSSTVNQFARLRSAVLFNHWLFQHEGLAWDEKREIASKYLERWAQAVEGEAAMIAGKAPSARSESNRP